MVNSILRGEKFPYLFLKSIFLSLILICCGSPEKLSVTHVKYNEIEDSKDKIIGSLKKDGCVWIVGLPVQYQTKRGHYLNTFKDFIDLPKHIKDQYKPKEFYAYGYSHEEETFKGKVEVYKSSLYFDSYLDNDKKDQSQEIKFIWPSEELKKTSMDVAEVIHEVIMKVVDVINIIDPSVLDKPAKGRCLHYSTISKVDNEMIWGQEHRDHGAITGLMQAAYLKDGKWVEEPSNCGLYIQGNYVKGIKRGILIQVGEAAELITNGQITATPHYIKGAPGYERITMAVFKNLKGSTKIYSNVTKYNERYNYGMTFEEYANNTFNTYYNIKSKL